MDHDLMIEGFHRLTREERLKRIQALTGINDDEVAYLSGQLVPSPELAEQLIENAVGYFPIPLGIACNLKIDEKDYLVPMAVEETSVIAAVSATARWIKKKGTIKTQSKGRLIIGQIEIPSLRDLEKTKQTLQDNRDFLIRLANEFVPGLVRRGGGVRDLTMRVLDRNTGSEEHSHKMLVLHVFCDPCDAMGANLINQVCEGLKPAIEQLTNEKVGLCILSNLVDSYLSTSEITLSEIEEELGHGIMEASRFAQSDPYRATTHNKGIMNGIDPVLIATGNDWRAVEAAVHAYASRSGTYRPLSQWTYEEGVLRGTLEAPLALGIVGGVTQSHPVARTCLKILGIEHANELSRICAAVGLVQNLAALKALSTDGIVKGHMKLHTSNLALAAGASVHELSFVQSRLKEILSREKRISLTQAKQVLEEYRKEQGA